MSPTTGKFLPCPRPSGPMPELQSRASLPSFQALVMFPSYPGGKPLHFLSSFETDQFEESWLPSKIRPIFSTRNRGTKEEGTNYFTYFLWVA